MQYRRLGAADIEVSALALGTDNFGTATPKSESIRIIQAALDAGINLIDTANTYGAGETERIIGEAITGRRNEVFLATKAYYPTGPGLDDRGGSRPAILKACDESLRRLRVDTIDLFQLHRPDFTVPIEETMGALHDLVTAGKVRFVGSSTSPAWRITEGIATAKAAGWQGFVSEQPPYNVLDRRIENEVVPMAIAHNIGLICWSPMAMGMLAGRYQNGDLLPTSSRASQRGGIYAERVTVAAVEAGNRFALAVSDAGLDPAQVAVCWAKEQPGIVAALIGPRSIDQLVHQLPVGSMTLPPEINELVDNICPPGGSVANFHNTADWMDTPDT